MKGSEIGKPVRSICISFVAATHLPLEHYHHHHHHHLSVSFFCIMMTMESRKSRHWSFHRYSPLKVVDLSFVVSKSIIVIPRALTQGPLTANGRKAFLSRQKPPPGRSRSSVEWERYRGGLEEILPLAKSIAYTSTQYERMYVRM